jgi:outer membrane protein assembly factor BamB
MKTPGTLVRMSVLIVLIGAGSFDPAFSLEQASTASQDWHQWRGPSRDGVVPAAATPAAWPATLRSAWRVAIGEGYSSPVVSGGRAFAHSRRDPDELVTALDAATGKVLWQQKYPAPFNKNQYAVKMAKGPNSTPIVIGSRVMTMGATGVLTAWDAATGKQLWRSDFSKTVDTSKLFCGTAASPLVVSGLLVVQVGSDVGGGQILALDPATGRAKWTWTGPGPGYASPVELSAAGTPQVVTMTNRSIVGLDAKTGTELWTTAFPDDWHENIVTPIWTGSLLIVSGVRQGTRAFELRQAGGKWQALDVWKNAEVAMYMSSPVYADGVIYGHSVRQKGQFVALDAKTGALRWASGGRQAQYASVLLTSRHVVFLTEMGELVIVRRDPAAFTIERRYQAADSETYALPVLLGSDVLVRDATSVIRLTPGK